MASGPMTYSAESRAEWNEAMIDGTSGGVRGGSFATGGVTLRASERPYEYYPDDEFHDVGFRAVRLVSPSQ